jgi:hypothetical protein
VFKPTDTSSDLQSIAKSPHGAAFARPVFVGDALIPGYAASPIRCSLSPFGGLATEWSCDHDRKPRAKIHQVDG